MSHPIIRLNVSRRSRKKLSGWARGVSALVISLLFFAPIYWMILTAFKSGNEAFTATPSLFAMPNLENFRLVFSQNDFGQALSTSLFVTTVSTLLCLAVGASIAYPLARQRMRGQKHIAFWILSLRIIPPIVTIIPLFLMLRAVGLTGSIWSLVLVYTYMNLPLTIWLLRGFFADLPIEIEDPHLSMAQVACVPSLT